MDILDNSLLHLVEKVRAWVNWKSDLTDCAGDTCNCLEDCSLCSQCNSSFVAFNQGYRCSVCGGLFCTRCTQRNRLSVNSNCKLGGPLDNTQVAALRELCFFRLGQEMLGKQAEKNALVDIAENCLQSSLSFSNDTVGSATVDGDSKVSPLCGGGECTNGLHNANGVGHLVQRQCCLSTLNPANLLLPVSLRCSTKTDDAETCDFTDPDDTDKSYSTPTCEYCGITSDIDATSDYSISELHSFTSATSSPFDSPSGADASPEKLDSAVPDCQLEYARSQDCVQLQVETSRSSSKDAEEIESPGCSINELSIYQNQYQEDDSFWLPPPPEDENDETENTVFESDDEYVGNSNLKFSSSSVGDGIVRKKGKLNEQHKESLRAVIHGHFRALVSQLLKGEGIDVGTDRTKDNWVDVATSLAWQAANLVKPDTSGDGSMDPCDYVKVKCIACGYPRESALVKGVVCTKNIKHKRMPSQYVNPKLLLLGGAMEYERCPNQLASIGTLLDQEMNDMKMKVSKIETYHPNVLLVEKSVSPYALEYLLAKDISLVLNVKRSVLERISRSTGAQIIPSIDNLTSPRLGQCEGFRLERVEEHRAIDGSNKKSVKTLMFFEGCPRRLGCTVLLRGASREELKKVKHAIQFAVFAAYHLSLETSFLADEGAALPKFPVGSPIALPETQLKFERAVSLISKSDVSIDKNQATGGIQAFSQLSELTSSLPKLEVQAQNMWRSDFNSENESFQSPNEYADPSFPFALSPTALNPTTARDVHLIVPPRGPDACVSYAMSTSCLESLSEKVKDLSMHSSHDAIMTGIPKEIQTVEEGALNLLSRTDASGEKTRLNAIEEEKLSEEFMLTVDAHQGIVVLLSIQCLMKGVVCERSQLLRIKFYGSSDKPLGRFLRDDLFNQASPYRSCSQPAEAHARRYIHQQGIVTMCAKHLPSLKLPGKPEGKIWMWHRCLKCALKGGDSQAIKRVIMSDAAWGLSFGKFLELSFSNSATAKHVASCGHSLQRDCLHYYGCGNMVAFFRYAPIDIFTVFLSPVVLEYKSQVQQEWIRQEAADVSGKMEILYIEVFGALQNMELKCTAVTPGSEPVTLNDFNSYVAELKNLIRTERSEYVSLLRSAALHNCQQGVSGGDIFELNYLRRCLLIDSYLWDRRLCFLDSLIKTKKSSTKFDLGNECRNMSSFRHWTETDASLRDGTLAPVLHGNTPRCCNSLDKSFNWQEDLSLLNLHSDYQVMLSAEGNPYSENPHVASDHLIDASGSMYLECSSLSDKIDMAWTGSAESLSGPNTQVSPLDNMEFGSSSQANQNVNNSGRKAMAPVRVYSFDSVLRFQERSQKSFLHTSRLAPVKSFHDSGDCGSLVMAPVPNIRRFYYRDFPSSSHRFDVILNYTPFFVSSSYRMLSEGPRVLLPSTGRNNTVVAVYDNEPTSLVAYALSSNEYESFVSDKSIDVGGPRPIKKFLTDENNMVHSQINSHLDSDDTQFISYGTDATVSSPRRLLGSDSPKLPHFRMIFGDDSSPGGKVRFMVTCYFAKQFDGLRRQCCPSGIDFLQSLSRCRRWGAQGGKSNVFFAKTLDERFIVKQVTKIELASFEEFALYYFKYLSDSLSSGSPTCLAKVLGIYQVTRKYLKTGKEEKMDFMVMENLFFGRTISQTYDLKGSARSRYNPDTSKVLLDENLLEALRTNPIFLGSKAKHCLERAVWNDTSFLASVDVMDYSLLVGIDEERKELVLGIIDFMRQYTWDKHLETWVKAAGILGGPKKKVPPTVISPKQYKKRFRKAMASYFLMVPEQ